MIWVLLQSESPWQRDDAITFFIYLCVSLYREFFLRNRLREFVPAIIASIMRVSMGLTDRRKTAKNLVDSRKN